MFETVSKTISLILCSKMKIFRFFSSLETFIFYKYVVSAEKLINSSVFIVLYLSIM